jgi:hypothetical protein
MAEAVTAWLQAHLTQPWSAATAATEGPQLHSELLEALPGAFPQLDPTLQQVRARE